MHCSTTFSALISQCIFSVMWTYKCATPLRRVHAVSPPDRVFIGPDIDMDLPAGDKDLADLTERHNLGDSMDER